MSEERDWLEAGKRVFVISRRSIHIGVVAKLTARDVVLESGTRYNRASLSRKLGGYDSERITALTNADSQHVYYSRQAQSAARKVADVSAAFAANPNDKGANDIENALGAWYIAAQTVKKVTNV